MGAILIISLLVLMLIGMPIAYALVLCSGITLVSTDFADLIIMVQRMFGGLDSFPILACPLFILAGYIMEGSSMSQRLVDWASCVCGRTRGGVGTVTIVACAIFAALTGSGPATVAAIGTIMYPALIDAGYPKNSSAALVAAGGALGPVIPPSIVMIIYGTTMGVSVPDMFTGAIVPGVLMAVALIAANNLMARRWGIEVSDKKYTAREVLGYTWKAAGTLFMPVLVLGGIYKGIFTATEAAAIACAYSLLISICYKSMTFKKLFEILKKSATVSAMGLLIVGSANVFGWLLAAGKIPATITTFLVPLLHTKVLYMAVLLILLFIIGTLMETSASVVILAPIIVPTGLALGFDPLHLGLVFVIALVVGYITPPFGVNLFTVCSTTGESYVDVVKGLVPYILTVIAAVILIAAFPVLTTVLL
ncbi:TRAP transporter large permease [Senimuribacter intestinalis]|uniref:TRAP transporter large permease n=1 Tax=Senimuribacter intestinalis TaxID=2941507 RepID=UPI00203D0561|nr:TRAP transporter large permease subunit [Senimuribacter intestinalis]